MSGGISDRRERESVCVMREGRESNRERDGERKERERERERERESDKENLYISSNFLRITRSKHIDFYRKYCVAEQSCLQCPDTN